MMENEYGFSIHMAIGIVEILVAGPLVVRMLAMRRLRTPLVRRLSKWIAGNAWLAWLAGTGTMWFWHIPAVHHWAMGMSERHIWWMAVQQLLLLMGGILFSWPLLGPCRGLRMHPLAGIIYLATACISCSLMGLLITFAPPEVYPGVSPRDRETAGLIMWVPGCLIYLTGCLLLLRQWLHRQDRPRIVLPKI
ncbi:MAG TPA: cytochrome c oxidase assembly protein [Puia sp.]|uniref:cytochrome c oxidase assembly protein n=1 Tax=Puia sp. TaxID=2045100 RepID=UPI002B7FC9DB|nr:cytochrome c oxidase assembly protein [Puia sp.]HVU94264.1 cytochrome c oxidase assembly protein [Puia sp.]